MQMAPAKALAAVLAFAALGAHAQDQSPKAVPATNGTYNVALQTVQVTDYSSMAPFAPGPEPRALELSIIHPTSDSNLSVVPYFPPLTARFLDIEHSTAFDLDAPSETFEKLGLQVAGGDSTVASAPSNGQWPVLLFSGAIGTTRLLYNSIASHVASNGYLVITIDTAHDTDIVEFSDGTIVQGNDTISEDVPDAADLAVLDVTARAQDASFVLDQLNNATFITAALPGCNDCLNTTHAGIFGHSIGGASAAAALLNETRLIGGLDYDGALWGDIVEHGTSKPFMIMATEGQTRASQDTTDNPNSSWAAIWEKLSGKKFDVILANSKHYTYSDIPLAVQTLGINASSDAMDKEQNTDLGGKRSFEIITRYTVAFFSTVFTGETDVLLKGPSADFPEITFDDDSNGAGNGTQSPSGEGRGDQAAGATISPAARWVVTIFMLVTLGVGCL